MTDKPLSLEVAKGSLILGLIHYNYQQILQAAENIHFTDENIHEDQLKPLSDLRNALKGRFTALKSPDWERCKAWDAAYNSLDGPLKAIFERKRQEKASVARRKQAEIDRINSENARINLIKGLILTKKLDFASQVRDSSTVEQLVSIEKRMGSEKTRTATYMEFIQELVDGLDELRPLIATQKKYFSEIKATEGKVASATSDDESLHALDEKLEILAGQVTESKTVIQETALRGSSLVAEQIAPQQVKTKWRAWKFEVTDIELLAKKHPEFVTLIPVEAALRKWFMAKKESGDLREEEVDGIRIWEDKRY